MANDACNDYRELEKKYNELKNESDRDKRLLNDMESLSPKKSILCRIGLHKWKRVIFNFEDINKYYQCSRCRARKAVENKNIYSPIDVNWLYDNS